MSKSPIATLTIERGIDGERYWQSFEVPYIDGASILDGLMWIREHRDQSLAFRYSCIAANVCKECVMRINGSNAYACVERLAQGETKVQPIASKPLIRDLAALNVPPKERVK